MSLKYTYFPLGGIKPTSTRCAAFLTPFLGLGIGMSGSGLGVGVFAAPVLAGGGWSDFGLMVDAVDAVGEVTCLGFWGYRGTSPTRKRTPL